MKYRAEIDGLRALAVAPVILFHAGFELFGGGFVGVDVFFVISGYLITTLLIEDLEHRRFSIVDFYERRARRILPALLLVMAVCIPFAWQWTLPKQMEDFSQSLIAVSFFASNILFWLESGYFAPTAEEKPLLHTWSLAVEEQYYVLFPIFLFFTWRYVGKQKAFFAIAIIASVSLLLSEWGWRHHPNANFYLSPSRAWELLAGSMAAFFVQQHGVKQNNTLSVLGLVAILYAIFMFDEKTPFPSLFALLPVGGVVALIVFAGKDTITAKLLSRKPLVGIGLISYSAYLWHQPILAFSRLRLAEQSVMLNVTLIIAVLILSYLSWRYIEKPFRNKNLVSRKSIFLFSAAGVLLFSLTGIFLGKHSSFDSRQTHIDSRISKLIKTETPSSIEAGWRAGVCFIYSGEDFYNTFEKDLCLNLNDKKPNILLFGDSHAAHWVYGLTSAFPEANILQATAAGCRPLLPSQGLQRCRELVDFIFNEFLPTNPVDTIILAARWESQESTQEVEASIQALSQYTKRVIVLGSVPEYRHSLSDIILGQSIFGELKNSDDISTFTPDKWLKKERFTAEEKIKNIVRSTTAEFVSTIDLMCQKNRCEWLTPQGKINTFDHGHLTLEASHNMAKKMKAQGIRFTPN